MNTSISKKEKLWSEFIKACESQWKCGGERYALKNVPDKEFTDLVTEAVGNQWVGGNIIKYVGEIINTKDFSGKVPEVNFFKIAVYAFIWWLKEYENREGRDRGEEYDAS
jgi:hypothetical protein